jgi:hypothetical protein
MVIQAGSGEAMLQPAAVVAAIRDGSCDYGGVFTARGTDRVGGLECDVYAFETRCGGPGAVTVAGEVCLSDAVPFGVVRQTSVTTDSNGTETSRSVQLLQDHGTGAVATPALLAALPATRGTLQVASTAGARSIPMQDAYRSGHLRVHVEVAAGSSGRQLVLTLANTTGEALAVKVPSGPTGFAVGSPLGTLEVAFERDATVTVGPGGSSAPLEAGQPGERGAVDGEFTISTYEGEPLLMGAVTVGPLG